MEHRVEKMLRCCLIVGLTLSLPSCKSDDDSAGNSTTLTEKQKSLCDESCDKLIECDGDYEQDCMEQCSDMASFLRESVFEALGECIDGASCADVNPDVCMEEAAKDVPDSVLDDFIESVCKKIGECEGSEEGCTDEFISGEDMIGFKLMSDANLDCLAACFGGKTCAQLETDGEDGFESCVSTCGLEMGDDGGGDGQDCGFIEGEWELESISCSGQDQDLENIAVTQNIAENCSGTGEITFGTCTISTEHAFELDNGSATWVAESIACGDGCGVDECTNMPNATARIQMSLSPSGKQLIFNYSADQTAIEAGMTPCREGELTIAVYGAK